MEELVKEGLVKNIGVSNVGVQLLRDILSYAEIKPSVLQVELHPYLTQNDLVTFCRENGIAVTAYSSFGVLSYKNMDNIDVHESCLEEDVVKQIGSKYNKTPAQVVLRWALQRGTAVIPKTSRENILKENFEI